MARPCYSCNWYLDSFLGGIVSQIRQPKLFSNLPDFTFHKRVNGQYILHHWILSNLSNAVGFSKPAIVKCNHVTLWKRSHFHKFLIWFTRVCPFVRPSACQNDSWWCVNNIWAVNGKSMQESRLYIAVDSDCVLCKSWAIWLEEKFTLYMSMTWCKKTINLGFSMKKIDLLHNFFLQFYRFVE